jgi:DNA polymerase I-like protein with 3'-5' exonuclease and polymerase domains
MGQLNLLTSADDVPLLDCIVQPGDPRWWETLAQWEKSKAVTADTETYCEAESAKGALNPWQNKPRLLQVGVEMPGEGIRVLIVDTLKYPNYQDSSFFKLLKRSVECSEFWVILQNGMFDLLCWRVWWGWRSQTIFDTFVASNLMWAGLPVRHRLQDQLVRFQLADLDKTEQTSDWGMPDLSSCQINYAANDVIHLFELSRKYYRYLGVQNQLDSLWIELRFLPALVEMEFNGLPLDVNKLKTYQSDYQRVYDELYAELNKTWKDYSPKVFGAKVIRSDIKIDSKSEIPQLIKDLTGEDYKNADKKTLIELGRNYPVLQKLSLCRTIKKSLDKFKAIDKAKRQHPTGVWVVSGAYKPFSKSDDGDDADYGAGTGRTGSGSGTKGAYLAPNLQNIPTYSKLPAELKTLGLKSIRECFAVVSNQGVGQFCIHDLAAAHARIAARLSGDALMAEIYTTDRDAHALTVVKLIKFLEDYDPKTMSITEVDVQLAKKAKEKTELQNLLIRLRDVGKNFYYGSLNDAGADVLYRLFQSSSLDISLENSNKALAEYFELYSGLGKFISSIKDEIKIPPMTLPPDIKTLVPRSASSRWFLFQGHWYYPVQVPTNTGMSRRVCRRVQIKRLKDGTRLAVGPKPSDVLATIWLGLESLAMKKAAAILYEWIVANQVDFYMGGITHDELDSWSLTPQFEAVQQQIRAMDYCMAEITAPIPAGPITSPNECMGQSWNDK